MATPNSIAHYLLKDVNRAVRDFDLIAPGDRIAVGVSGGKDSRMLLELLLRGVQLPPGPEVARQPAYEVVAIHVDGSGVGLPDQRPTLEPWLESLGVDYEIAPLEAPEDEPLPMDCFRCAWNRRKSLFTVADRLGCHKVAFGHHADDAAVTTLLNLLYKGRLETLEPRREFFGGRVTIIRPLIYLTAAEIARYARARGWEFPPELECPREKDTRRVKVENFLRSLSGKEQEQIRANLWRVANEARGHVQEG
ncbi:MAG: tRNA 2-thiocytidine biosynthesis protein TtcA [Anaerolineae bacterium]|nr:tRNA 2-thiocytidine biosynthesis protein TtcA [Anaerolineae bacterium]